MDVNKPLSLLKEEYKQNLVELTNNSGLHLFVVEYVLKELLETVHIASQQQIERDKQIYINKLKENKNENNKNEN